MASSRARYVLDPSVRTIDQPSQMPAPIPRPAMVAPAAPPSFPLHSAGEAQVSSAVTAQPQASSIGNVLPPAEQAGYTESTAGQVAAPVQTPSPRAQTPAVQWTSERVLEVCPKANAHADYIRLSVHGMPCNMQLKNKWALPVGAIFHPLAPTPRDEVSTHYFIGCALSLLGARTSGQLRATAPSAMHPLPYLHQPLCAVP